MSELKIIQTNRLGKKYLLDKAIRPDNLREAVAAFFRFTGHSAATTGTPNPGRSRELWALKEVDLQVQEGEILGIIGKNGAGKSTLLKVLSRVTEATEGSAVIHGRIASLLEIGIGFHPDLTGRENVFLNAALLGMKRAAVKDRFDEIVEFAGIGDFIDTQVKKYSSGMFVRLAFSIAAHLDSEVVFIDEVLAVGDTDFQKKCIARIRSVANSGRTVLFVSHNLAAIEQLCNRCIVFDHGRIGYDGKTNAALNYYRTNILEKTDRHGNLEIDSEKRPGNGRARFQFLKITGDASDNAILTGGAVNFEIGLKVAKQIIEPRLAIIFKDQSGQVILKLSTRDSQFALPTLENDVRVNCRVPELLLAARIYQVDLWLNERGQTIDYVESAELLSVISATESVSDIYYKGFVEIPAAWFINP